jgi:vesicle coat complex subunit
LPLFRDADPGFRSYAIVHLARYGRAAAPVIPMLIETIREQQDPNLRQLAVDALRRISGDPEQVLLVVADLLVDQDATVRRNAIDAIRSFDSTARNYLATLHRLKQEDPSPDVRRAAGFAIREIQGDGGQ